MKKIKVTAGILRKNNYLLITQRKENSSFGLMWEFPGGKMELNETPEECLKRELFEELNINVVVGKLFCISDYRNLDIEIELMVYSIDSFEGDLIINAHEQIKWITIDEIDNYKFAPADIEIVNKLKKALQWF